MDDWVLLLEEGQSNLDELERFRSTTRSSLVDTDMELGPSTTHDLSLQAVLFKALHGFTKQSRGSNMLFNLQAAAFHLSFMLKGCTASDKLVSIHLFQKDYRMKHF
jgi:hypothetical protein